MPQYQYTSSDENGELRLGFIEAGSEESARNLLAEQGIVAESVELTSANHGSANQDSTESQPSGSSAWMTTDEHVEVVGQIGHLVSAGLPLAAGLRTLSEEVPSKRLRKIFDRLSSKLDEGMSLEDVLKAESSDLPEWLAAVFAAGTRSGRLPECIQHFIEFSRLRAGIRIKLLISMVYPAILMVAGMAVCCFLSSMVVAEYRQVLEGFGAELPWLTLAVLELSSLVETTIRYWPVSLLIFWSSVLAIWLGSKAVLGAASVRRLVYHIPLLGRVFKQSALAEFSQLLALMIEARIPLPEALKLVGSAVRDPNLSEGAYLAAKLIDSGESFGDLRGVVRGIPDELLRVPGWGKNDSSLVESLRVSSEVFALQSEISGQNLAGMVTPAAVIIAGGMIALTVIALFMPLIKLLNDLS
ncbi:MAG: type II secretion system F family protein [Planctomycetota bacterium]|nr:type II secretion system F family protein [Planctomycetota bacterium]MDA0919480.1 type II secretion system F family protein [Planctomycetota bacterium]